VESFKDVTNGLFLLLLLFHPGLPGAVQTLVRLVQVSPGCSEQYIRMQAHLVIRVGELKANDAVCSDDVG